MKKDLEPTRDWTSFAKWLLAVAQRSKGGRGTLRRRWENLRRLADEALEHISEDEVQRLLGRKIASLDPEQNDLKAIVAYAIGRGLLPDPERLGQALDDDVIADPMAFLAALSGKAFGESWAPEIAKYWLCRENDRWEKKNNREYYDVGWSPSELAGKEVRIELKASSESPAFRFQQLRHPHLVGQDSDYDILLCVGATARSLEWWTIPTKHFDLLAENGLVANNEVVIALHHGKRRPIWNAATGYKDEGWFSTDQRVRDLLRIFYADSARLREHLLAIVESK